MIHKYIRKSVKAHFVMMFISIVILFFFLTVNNAYAYEIHEPIQLKNIHATKNNPYVIEGYEISNPDGNCIEIRDSENIIIRDNYLHDCKLTPFPTERNVQQPDGYAIYVSGINNLEIENNRIEDNFRGVEVYGSKNIAIKSNNQTGTYRDACFRIDKSYNITFYENFLENNGATEVLRPVSEGVEEGDGRLQGVVLWQTSLGRIYRNIIINSSSDGIGVAGSTLEEPEKRASDFLIYNNTILYNGEQGIWFEGANNAKIFDNNIAFNKARPGFGGGSSGIMFEFDVSDVEIYNNVIEANDGCGVSIRNSHTNIVRNNIIKDHFNPGVCFFGGKTTLSTYWSIGRYDNKIAKNTFQNNHLGGIAFEIGWDFSGTKIMDNAFDQTKEESIQSRDDTRWYAGEIPEGVLIENNLFLQKKSLEKVPQDYIKNEETEQQKEQRLQENSSNRFEVCNYNPEKVYAILFFLTLTILIVCLVYIYWTKKRLGKKI